MAATAGGRRGQSEGDEQISVGCAPPDRGGHGTVDTPPHDDLDQLVHGEDNGQRRQRQLGSPAYVTETVNGDHSDEQPGGCVHLWRRHTRPSRRLTNLHWHRARPCAHWTTRWGVPSGPEGLYRVVQSISGGHRRGHEVGLAGRHRHRLGRSGQLDTTRSQLRMAPDNENEYRQDGVDGFPLISMAPCSGEPE